MSSSTTNSNESSLPQPSDNRARWWNPFHWRFAVWVGLVVCFFALLPFGFRWYVLSQVPVMAEPFDIAAFVVEPIPDDENAFTEYRQAITMLEALQKPLAARSIQQPRNLNKSEELDWDPADAEMQAWLEEHRAVLAVWRRGTEKDRALAFDLTQVSVNYSVINHYFELHKLSQSALAEQARSLHEGNVEEARRLARAVFRCGGHVSWRSTFLNGLLGMTLHEMSFLGIRRWAEHPSVTAEQLRNALAEVRTDFKLYDAESSMMKLEYVALRNTVSRRNVLLDLADTGVIGPPMNSAMRFGRAGMLWLNGEPDLILRLLDQITANQLREVDKSVANRRRLLSSNPTILFDSDGDVDRADGELTGTEIINALKLSSVASLMVSSRRQFDQCYRALLARQAVLKTLLALQIYRREQGVFPERLDQLVPEFLEAVPLDPCHPAVTPLVYRRNSQQQFVLYSIGSNSTDDGGALGSNERSPDIGFELKETP